MSIGEKILKLRKAKNYSQEEVANQLNVSRQTVSKWETNQSTPDFDKIVPLCELFGITTDELLRDISIEQEVKEEKSLDVSTKKKTALVVSVSVLLYFFSIIWIIVSTEVFRLPDGLCCGIFLFICAVPTAMLVYHFMSTNVEKKEEKVVLKRNKMLDMIDGVLALITTFIYLLISFITGAWHITWIVWILYAIVIKIVELVFELKGDKHE